MIKVKNLTHYYNNDKALENINLEINPDYAIEKVHS